MPTLTYSIDSVWPEQTGPFRSPEATVATSILSQFEL